MPECRFCLNDGKEEDIDDPLLSPCKCIGSAKFVHTLCLEKWRTTDLRINQHFLCPVCNTKYNPNLVLFNEIIPDLTKSMMIKIILNPLIMPICIHYLYFCLINDFNPGISICNNHYNETEYFCHYESTPIFIYRSYYILLQILYSSFVLGLYLCFLNNVESKRRYLKHSLKFCLLPAFHLVSLYFLNKYMILAGSINLSLLPIYLRTHVHILKSMNEKL